MADSSNDAIIAAVIAAFLLSASDQKALAAAIYQALQDAYIAAYEEQVDALGIDAEDVTIPDDVLKDMAANSKDAAESIVNTYNDSVKLNAEQLANSITSDDFKNSLTDELTAWAKARDAWKSAQIANYTASQGYSSGMAQFVDDILTGDLDLPDGVAQSDLVVVVEPSSAEEPECQAICDGSPYPIDQADDALDVFPLHLNCDHFSYVTFAS